MKVLVFSKDRAMQLDALLRSIRENVLGDPHPPKPVVLFTASTPEFDDGYRQCFLEHASVDFVRQHRFQDDYLHMLPAGRGDHVVHFVDDQIVHRGVNLAHAAFELDRDEQLFAFALRMGVNCVRCYPHDAEQRLPAFAHSLPPLLRWSWVGADLDWGYAGSLDANVYRAEDVYRLIDGADFDSPNTLEDAMAQRVHRFAFRPRMASYHRSCATGVPANIVNVTHANRNANLYDPAWLNALYLDGTRIDWRAMNWDCVDAAHVVLPYVFSNLADKDAA